MTSGVPVHSSMLSMTVKHLMTVPGASNGDKNWMLKPINTGSLVVTLVLAAILACVYIPKNQQLTYLASSGSQRDIVPLNVAAFWLLLFIAMVVAIIYFLRRGYLR